MQREGSDDHDAMWSCVDADLLAAIRDVVVRGRPNVV